MNRIFLIPVCVALMAGAVGCGTVPDTITHQPGNVQPQQAVAAPAANGAIFQSGSYRPMFEDRRARLVGDILTIAINERTSAAKNAATSASKSGSAQGSVSSLFGNEMPSLNVAASSSNKFEEKGAASSSNNFSGTLTVTVVDVLPNGNLLVSGEKQIALDKGVEYVRFSGVVSPTTIGAGNIVSSTQVADARLEYRTNTRLDKAEIMSQLARFFLSIVPL